MNTSARNSRRRPAPQQLFQANTGLVGLCLKRFPFLAGEAREEAYGAGLLGLWTAAQRYDPGRGFTFSTFARDYIRGYILRRLKEERRQQRLPCVSLETPIGNEDGGGALADMIADGNAEKPGSAAMDQAGFEAWLSRLPEKQQDVLRGVYLHEKTLSEIAEELGGMTRQRVHQLHQSALRRLQTRRRLSG